MKAIFNPSSGKFSRLELTESEFETAQDDTLGVCVKCGAEQYGFEPDARRAICEVCDEDGVYGFEELVLLDRVKVTAEQGFLPPELEEDDEERAT